MAMNAKMILDYETAIFLFVLFLYFMLIIQ